MSSLPANISVAAPVVITTQPLSQTHLQGRSANFGVGASGAPPYRYQWQFNGVVTCRARPMPPSFSPPVCVGDSGGYRAVVTDDFNSSATSAVATLSVIAVPAGSYMEAVVNHDPVAYWRLGEQGGTTAFDHVGGNHATYVNTTLGQPGALGSDSTYPRDSTAFPPMPAAGSAWPITARPLPWKAGLNWVPPRGWDSGARTTPSNSV